MAERVFPNILPDSRLPLYSQSTVQSTVHRVTINCLLLLVIGSLGPTTYGRMVLFWVYFSSFRFCNGPLSTVLFFSLFYTRICTHALTDPATAT